MEYTVIMKKTNSTRRNNDKTADCGENETDPVAEEKERLRKEISKLTNVISEIEFSLNLTRFGSINSAKLELPEHYQRVYKFKNLDYVLQHELHKLSGLYCTKCEAHEFIFNFSPFSRTKSTETYGIQFFTNDGKGRMGRYVMPTSGIMENILVETPIDQLIGLIPFFRNCKRHLDCFVDRKEQFEGLRTSTMEFKNFSVDTDIGFAFITCLFMQCYHKTSDQLVNLTVYLSYDYGKARPSTINVDWSGKAPTEEEMKAMRSFVKVFKTYDLGEAFVRIKDSKHNIFEWHPEKKSDDSRDWRMQRGEEEVEEMADEGEKFSVENEDKDGQSEEDGRRPRKRAVLREAQQVKQPAKKTKSSIKPSGTIDKPRKGRTGNLGKAKIQLKKSEEEARTSKERTAGLQDLDKSNAFERPKMRQSLLAFGKVSSNPTDEQMKKKKKKTMTSTPMHRTVKDKSTLKVLEISPIVSERERPGKPNKSPKKGKRPRQ